MRSQSEVARAVKDWLTNADLPDGRLPSERALADRFRVNRAELRKVFGTLEAEGRIVRHVGRGTFLTEVRPAVPANAKEIAKHVSPLAAMQARMVVEPEIASLASVHATTAQMDELRRLSALMRKVESWAEYEEYDWQFHNLLADACGNKLLFEIQHLLNGVRRAVVWGHLARPGKAPAANYHSFNEHDAIVEAVRRRDRKSAKRAMEVHLKGTTSMVVDG
jgi:DNA-binding FadR family transcriptional regulator